MLPRSKPHAGKEGKRSRWPQMVDVSYLLKIQESKFVYMVSKISIILKGFQAHLRSLPFSS